MLYRIVRPIATLGILLFFRKVYLIHRERIPENQPVVLAVNHPTAFLEPCILACILGRPLYFLVRGDFFEKKIFNFLLRALHMLPVYRKKDKGLRAVKDNYATFEACSSALAENKTIMILAEGSTSYTKRLRPLKKGVARVAFGALEAENSVQEVYVVPIGVTFTDASRFRSEVIVAVGAPLRASDYFERSNSGRKAGVERFNQALYTGLSEQMVLIQNPKDDAVVEGVLTWVRARLPWGGWWPLDKKAGRLQAEQAGTAPINEASEARKKPVREAWDGYAELLEATGLRRGDLAEMDRNTPGTTAAVLLGAPMYAIGWVLNSWPFWLVEWLVRTKVPVLEFKLSIRLSVGIFAWLFWWLGVWIVAALAGGPFWIPFFVMPITGLFCVYYTDLFRNWIRRVRWNRLSENRRESLHHQYTHLKGMIQSL